MFPVIMFAMTSGVADRRRRLGEAVTALRKKRHSGRGGVDAAAAEAQMSATTWQRVEDGKTVRALTYRGVEDVLGLRPGVIDDYLDGLVELANLEDTADEGTITVRGLTPEEVRAFENFAKALWKARRNSA